jgi:hypothetical protein
MASQAETPATSPDAHCSICREVVPEAARVQLRPCLHSDFCIECLRSWFGAHHSSCPLCRAQIRAYSVAGAAEIAFQPTVPESVSGLIARLHQAITEVVGGGDDINIIVEVQFV